MTATQTLFELLDIDSGTALQKHCMDNPNEDLVKEHYGEGLAPLYQKALGSMCGALINDTMLGSMTREEQEDAARYSLFLVGMARVDGCKYGIADLLRIADELPQQVLELSVQLFIESGLHEMCQACGVSDENLSLEELNKRVTEYQENHE